jgi:hypothetical protein
MALSTVDIKPPPLSEQLDRLTPADSHFNATPTEASLAVRCVFPA